MLSNGEIVGIHAHQACNTRTKEYFKFLRTLKYWDSWSHFVGRSDLHVSESYWLRYDDLWEGLGNTLNCNGHGVRAEENLRDAERGEAMGLETGMKGPSEAASKPALKGTFHSVIENRGMMVRMSIVQCADAR